MPKMKKHLGKCFRSPGAWAAVGCLLGASSTALAQPEVYGDPSSSRFILIPPGADDWTLHFRVGALVGLNIKADFTTRGTFGVSGNDPSKGIYDNGYVRPDSESANDGLTGFWGYNNASQLSGQTLQMSATSSFMTANSTSESGKVFPGFELAYGDNYWYWKHARVGWELGFGMLPIEISENRPMAASVNQSTYSFDVSGLLPFVPGAGYQGNLNKDGPLIPYSPFHTDTQQISNGTVTGTRKLDLNLFTLRLGPSFYWDVADNVGVSLGAGPAMGIATGEYSFNENIIANGVNSHNSGKIDSTEVVYGGYVNATVMYHIHDNGKIGDIYLSAEYMPLGDATIGGGGQEGQLKLGGQVYISAGLNWPF
jgi:hypothetical protein